MELTGNNVAGVKLKFPKVQDHLVRDLKRWLACRGLLMSGNKNVLIERKMSATSEFWIQCFRCCITQPQTKRPRLRIDRSMIGAPSNFQHLSHVGSRDVQVPDEQLIALQNQMQSKGGYDARFRVNVQTC